MRSIIFVFVIFLIIFSLISLVNHYLFRTNALDLAVFNHALYNYSHFKLSYFTLGLSEKESGIVECFGNHFSPIIFLFTPFYYLFGSYAMLIIQIGFILFGGWGIYKYACLLHFKQNLIVLFLIHFFSIWGIYSALSFDFHMNVIAAMFVPWLFYFYRKRNVLSVIIVAILMLLCRENISIWLVFIFLGIWINNKFESFGRNKFVMPLMILVSALYFVLIIRYVMPEFVPYQSAGQLSRYNYLGGSLLEIVQSIIQRPWDTVKLLFRSPLEEDIYKNIKLELHIMVLLSGGFLFLKRPAFLIMLVPIFLQKLLSTDYGMWGVNYHYSIEFVPILSILAMESTVSLKSERVKTILVSIVVGATILSTTYTFFHRESLWYDKNKTCFICPEHYRSEQNINLIIKSISKIPKDASVSAHYCIGAHLANREKIYHYPILGDASFVVLLKRAANYYPLQQEVYFNKMEEFRSNPDFSVWLENESVLIFNKKTEVHERH